MDLSVLNYCIILNSIQPIFTPYILYAVYCAKGQESSHRQDAVQWEIETFGIVFEHYYLYILYIFKLLYSY